LLLLLCDGILGGDWDEADEEDEEENCFWRGDGDIGVCLDEVLLVNGVVGDRAWVASRLHDLVFGGGRNGIVGRAWCGSR
jgi:hypothetical protein